MVDMINDFVTGKLGSENAEAIVPDLKRFLEEAKEKHILRVFAEDNHEEGDPELSHWGQHAMREEEGSETIPELQGLASHKIQKRFYDAFYKTELENVLKKNGIKEVILTGVATEICVQNTAAGAFYRGFDITVLRDCTASPTVEKHKEALDYMESIFGADVRKSDRLKK